MDMQESAAAPHSRAVGIALALLAFASLALVLNHPSGAAHDFAEMLKEEAAHRVADAVVHGGFIAILGGELACLAVLLMRPAIRPWAIVALVLFAIGTGFLMLSMLIDGLVTPALAARYADVPDKQESARAVFVLLATLIGFLMPAGLLFQAVALGLAAAGLWRPDALVRCASVWGVLVALAAIAGVAATAAASPHVVIAALLGFAAWYAATGTAMALGRL
ncbi:MAG: hypothetical protein ACXWIG_11625 [Caldimonas sp.]